jgi:hypothetical protein
LVPSTREKSATSRGPDWHCSGCGFETNFNKRETCYRCGGPRPPSQHVKQREAASPSPARGQQPWAKQPQPSPNTLGGWFAAELQQKEQKEKRLQKEQLQAAKNGSGLAASAPHAGGLTAPQASGAAAVVPTVGVKERIAALEAVISTLGASDPEVSQLKLKKESEVLQLRAQLEADRPLRSRLQLATEGRDRMVKVLQTHRQDITSLEYFLGLKRDLARQSEEELALRAGEGAALAAEYEVELAQQLLPSPLTPVGALPLPPQQVCSPAHWAAGFSASLTSVAPDTAANFHAWLQTQPSLQARHVNLVEPEEEEWDEDDDVMEGGDDAALAAGLQSAAGSSQPGATSAAPQFLPGQVRGSAAFGAAGRPRRRRVEPYVKEESPASLAVAVENLSESDEELLSACKRVELAAAAAAAAEVMNRMGAGATAGATA